MEDLDAHPAVRLAAAEALVALEAKDAAPALLRRAQEDEGDLRDLVEPVLARWDYRPARAAWLERLRDPAASPRGLTVAMQCLAAVKEEQAANGLREIVLSDGAAGPVRLEAARALGLVRDQGLETDAERLAGDASPRGLAGRLAAAALLRRHSGNKAVRLLRCLAEDPEPAVAAPAVERLIEIDPDLAAPMAERLAASPDAGLRSLAVDVLYRRPAGPHLGLLADRLADADREVRTEARRDLEALAADGKSREPVVAEATRVLAARPWQGQEQAAILLTDLGHKPAARRLVELLPSDRPEAAVTAAWGLRRLAVPETLPAVKAYVEAALKRARSAAPPAQEVLDHQLSQLNQLLGGQKYGPAEDVLRQFIPRMEPPMRSVACPESRAAAVWALGLMDQDAPDEALAAALEGRLNDTSSQPPEDGRVRAMSAVALGRMKAKAALPSLRAAFNGREPWFDPVDHACRWATGRITGEAASAPKTVDKDVNEQFLRPYD